MFLKRAFFNFVLCNCNVDTGKGAGGDGFIELKTVESTLGSFACLSECGGEVVGSTLGDGVSTLTGSGMVSILLSCVANSGNAFLTGLPSCKVGVVVDGGLVRMVIMSVAACLRKSTSLT